MKKLMFLLMIAAFTLFNCGEKTEAPAAPATETAEAPAPAPAEETAPATEEKSMDHPWANAKVGDWAQYKTEAAGMTTEMKYTVTEVTADSVTYNMETTVAGNTMSQTMTLPLTAPEAVATEATEAPAVEMTDETVEIAGQSLACKKSSVETEAGKVETWMSSQVRAGGLVKSVTSVSTTELVAFGSAE